MLASGTKVGEFLCSGIRRLPAGAHYNYTTCGHRLVLSLDPPVQDSVEAVEQRKGVFGLVVRENVIIMIAGFGVSCWAASHYNWWFNPPHLCPNLFAAIESRDLEIPLEVFLANSTTGLIEAVQTFHLPSNFSRILLEKISAQLNCEFNPWRHLDVAKEVMGSNPNRIFLMKQAVCVCSCGMALPAWDILQEAV